MRTDIDRLDISIRVYAIPDGSKTSYSSIFYIIDDAFEAEDSDYSPSSSFITTIDIAAAPSIYNPSRTL